MPTRSGTGTTSPLQTGRARPLLPQRYPKERKLVDRTSASWNPVALAEGARGTPLARRDFAESPSPPIAYVQHMPEDREAE